MQKDLQQQGLNRRHFLATAAGRGCAVAAAGTAGLGGLWAYDTYASNQLSKKLMAQATPVLVANVTAELKTLPTKAEEKIRTWFHAPCLNAHAFVREICSDRFAATLAACGNDEELQKGCVLNAFVSHVGSADEIVNRVKIIAREIGRDLDNNWATCCSTVALKWGKLITHTDTPLSSKLSTRVREIITQDIDDALKLTLPATQRPMFSGVVKKIGETAILILPIVTVSRLAAAIGVPLFLFVAFGHLYEYFMNRLDQRTIKEVQQAIAREVADIANRVGAELATEVRTRITALHIWQGSSLSQTAEEFADESVGIF